MSRNSGEAMGLGDVTGGIAVNCVQVDIGHLWPPLEGPPPR
jgi:hypothetical protein